MKARTAKKGFTAVELMVAMVSGSVLAITAGTMLFYGYLGWQRNLVNTEVQRDATFAMDFISRAIRPAIATNVVAGGSTIKITQTNGVEVTIFKQVNDLVHMSSTNTTVLINGRLQVFTVGVVSNQGITVDMQVQEGEASTQVNSFYAFRN